MIGAAAPGESRRADQWAVLAATLLGMALYATSLRNGFAYDDVPIISLNPFVKEFQPVAAYFGSSYWGPPTGSESAYRPLTVLLFAAQWVFGGGGTQMFHAVNVALYGICCGLAYGVLRPLLDQRGALVATVAFAVTPLHVEAVANVVGQAELWVFALLATGLLLYLDARASGRFTPLRIVAIAGVYGLAVCFKEHAAVLPALLLAYELVLGLGWRRLLGREGDGHRLTILAMGIPVAAFIAARLTISTEDIPYFDIAEMSAGQRAMVMLRLLPRILRLLVWPDHLAADYSAQFVTAKAVADGAFWAGAALFVGLVVLAIALRRRRPVVTYGLLWAGLAFLPVSNLAFPSGVLIAERTLFLPSLGVAMVLGACVTPLRDAVASLPLARRALLVLGAAVASLGAVATVDRIPAWEDNPSVFAQLAADVPTNARAWFALGELNEGGGRAAAADSLYRRALALTPTHPMMRMNYAMFLQSQGRCPEALPLLEALRRDFPLMSTAYVALTGCFLTMRRYQEARLTAMEGLAGGAGNRTLRKLRRAADSLLVASDTVDARNRWAREGRPFNRTGLQYIVLVKRGPAAMQGAIGRLQQMSSSAADSR